MEINPRRKRGKRSLRRITKSFQRKNPLESTHKRLTSRAINRASSISDGNTCRIGDVPQGRELWSVFEIRVLSKVGVNG